MFLHNERLQAIKLINDGLSNTQIVQVIGSGVTKSDVNGLRKAILNTDGKVERIKEWIAMLPRNDVKQVREFLREVA